MVVKEFGKTVGGEKLTETITIPSQLNEARFVLVRAKEKGAFEPGWETTTNYDITSPKLLEHLKTGGNYGVMSRNGICQIDIDIPEEFAKLKPKYITETFSVRRGKNGNGHIYFTCPDCPPEKRGKYDTPFGDVRLGGNFYVVGPGCAHPSGDIYEVNSAQPISDIPWAEISRLIEGSKSKDLIIDEDAPIRHPHRHTTLLSKACSIANKDLTESAVLAELRQFNIKRCDPPKRDEEIQSIARSACEYVKKHPAKKQNGGGTTSPDGKKADNKKKIPEYVFQEKGWHERDGSLFLTTIDAVKQKFSFVCFEDNKVQKFDEIGIRLPVIDNGLVVIPGKKIIPRKPPMNKDGEYIFMVGIPDTTAVLDAPDETAGRIMELIKSHIVKYADMTVLDTKLCVYYIFMTWFYPKLTTVPYLRFRADTGKGKTRILKVVADMTLLPVTASGASTSAGIIRFHESWRTTLIIDEADLKGESDDGGGYTNDMTKYLNLGFEKGQYFIKADKVDPKHQEVFDPFSPKIIAMRGTFQDPATEGRCLSISPSETERKDIDAVLPWEYYHDVLLLRATLARYTIKNWNVISVADPYPSLNDLSIEPRLKQLGSPIAKILSKILPDGITEFKHYLEQRQKEIRVDRSMSFFGNLANAVYDQATDPENLINCVRISDVIERTGVSSNKASRALKESGFVIEAHLISIPYKKPDGTTIMRRITSKTVRVIDMRTWREISHRYILPKTEQTTIIENKEIDCPMAIRSIQFVSN